MGSISPINKENLIHLYESDDDGYRMYFFLGKKRSGQSGYISKKGYTRSLINADEIVFLPKEFLWVQ